jgi:RNA polymerase sigma-70 factor (ECF subfamily)
MRPGGKTTFEQAMLAELPKIRAYAMKLTRDREKAQDLVQETVARALRARGQFLPGTNLSAWLHTICRNRFMSDQRRDWRQVPVEDVMFDALVAPAMGPIRLELADALEAMADLPEAQRTALELICVGWEYPDAAEVLGLPRGTVKSQVHRARTRLLKGLSA